MVNAKSGALEMRDRFLAQDPDYYVKLGQKGGKVKKTKPGGFAVLSPEQRREVSAKGGRASRRRKRV